MSPSPAPRSVPSQVVTSPLAEKVPQCLEPKTGSVSEAVLLLPVPEAVWLLQFSWSPSAVHELICADWSQRDPGHKMAPLPALAVRALPGGHLSSGGEGSWMSGGQNEVCPSSCVNSVCPRSCVASVVHTLT